MEVWIFLIIFGAVLLIAAGSLWFSEDPANSFLLYKVAGIRQMKKEDARRTARQIASAVAGVGLALIVFSIIKMV